MSKYTPTPWPTAFAKYSASVRPVAQGGLIANCYLGDMPNNEVRDPDSPPTEGELAEQVANAARVVVCVNACDPAAGATDFMCPSCDDSGLFKTRTTVHSVFHLECPCCGLQEPYRSTKNH